MMPSMVREQDESGMFDLPYGNVARGSRRAGRPPDLPAREKTKVG